ncbi:Rap guanine nucleotide exchange factor 4 [Borealophlyctis nickersoniae]|nr:Rap guanine nucleotide exchange factor 4 [Borealophlyctis nickersoniae]
MVDECSTTHTHDCTVPTTKPTNPPRSPPFNVDVSRLLKETQRIWPSNNVLVHFPPPDLTSTSTSPSKQGAHEDWDRAQRVDWDRHVAFLKSLDVCVVRASEDGKRRVPPSGGGPVASTAKTERTGKAVDSVGGTIPPAEMAIIKKIGLSKLFSGSLSHSVADYDGGLGMPSERRRGTLGRAQSHLRGRRHPKRARENIGRPKSLETDDRGFPGAEGVVHPATVLNQRVRDEPSGHFARMATIPDDDTPLHPAASSFSGRGDLAEFPQQKHPQVRRVTSIRQPVNRRGAIDDSSPRDELVRILRKDHHERTQREIQRLFSGLRHMPAFNKMSDFVLTQLCGVFYLNEYLENRVVFRQGDQGSSWYVILEGKVDVRIAAGRPAASRPRTEEGSRLAHVATARLMEESKYIVTLQEGDGFGELALVNDAPRAATILTAEPCKLLRVEKVDYTRVLKFTHDKEREEKVHFLKNVPILSGLDIHDLNSIANVMQTRTRRSDTYAVRQGQAVTEVCFVKSGRCEAFAYLELTPEEYEEILPLTGPIGEHKRHKDSQTLPPMCHRVQVSLGYLEPGDYFGEEAAMAHTPLRNTTSAPGTADSSSPRHKVSIRCITDVEICVLQAYDARWRIRNRLRPTKITQLATDKEQILNKFLEQKDAARWQKYRTKQMDGFVREIMGDPNLNAHLYWSRKAWMKEVPFRF